MNRQGHKWNTADTIPSVRIVLSLCLVFLPLDTAGFLALYTCAGLTDGLDGFLARKTGTASDFGARLDSIADLLFYGALLIHLLHRDYRAERKSLFPRIGSVPAKADDVL